MKRYLMFYMVLAAFTVLWGENALAERRTALVIGNGSYLESPLNNPVNDAKDMASVLQDCGFEVILRTNKNRAGMEEAIGLFGARLKQGGVGLFFYAGHGVQVQGINYMIPVNAKVKEIKTLSDIEADCVKIPQVLSAMEKAENGLNIVILDACRNNPFQTIQGVSGGLALMDAPKGSYIAFSTRPGAMSGDGSARNGLYTSKLLKHIRTPGLSLVDMFMNVRNDVMLASNETQEPWDNHALRRHFYFVPKGTELSQPYGTAVVDEEYTKSYPQTEDAQAQEETIFQTIPDVAFDEDAQEEPDAPAGYYKQVVVEYHNGVPVEVVYYVAEETDDPPITYYDPPEYENSYEPDPPPPEPQPVIIYRKPPPKPLKYNRPRVKPPARRPRQKVNMLYSGGRPPRPNPAYRSPRPR